MEIDKCIHCHQCQNHCEFLKKYQLDIGDITINQQELIYHCFLCGKCSEVCPVGIDGKNYILDLREKNIITNQKIQNDNKLLLWEKKKYKYANYRNIIKGNSVLFLGCNFPSFYPKTTKVIVDYFKQYNVGTIYDCCGKPIFDLGLKEDANEIVDKINKKLVENNVQEVIMVCPNCYYFLKDKLSVKVVDIYSKLIEFKMVNKNLDSKKIFLPCPDRKNKMILDNISICFNKNQKLNCIEDVQCCGLGGLANKQDKKLVEDMLKDKININEYIYTYCASCAGNLYKQGFRNTNHILVDVFKTDEKPDVNKSMFNRIKFKFK